MLDFNPMELMIIGALGVLLFGERLPEVGRSVGKQLSQLKKGMRAVQDQIREAVDTSVSGSTTPGHEPGEIYYDEVDDREEATAPKFEPPPLTQEPAKPASAAGGSDDQGVAPGRSQPPRNSLRTEPLGWNDPPIGAGASEPPEGGHPVSGRA